MTTTDTTSREQTITKVTLVGLVVNFVLTAAKLMAGILGHSAAMVSDAIHSLSDFVTDIVVLVFIKISSKGRDKGHDFGHGKFETFATLIIAILLMAVAIGLLVSGIEKSIGVIHGDVLPAPKAIALWAAVASIVVKEWLYQYTARVGRKTDCQTVIANAWHHRSDALSSIGSFLGIGGAMLLGRQWTILDPLAGCVISVFIFIAALKIAHPSFSELLEASLPTETEHEIEQIACNVPGVRDLHELKTRRNGPSIIIDAHLVVDPSLTVLEAHNICTETEERLIERFGPATQTSIHIEPDINAK